MILRIFRLIYEIFDDFTWTYVDSIGLSKVHGHPFGHIRLHLEDVDIPFQPHK